MSRYVLDTTVLIDFSKGVEPTTARVLNLIATKADLYLSAVQLTEFYAGASVGDFPDVDTFLSRLHFAPLTPEVVLTAGSFRYQAKAQARSLATPDALIAALGHHLSATILTNNVNDFTVTGVAVEQLGGAGEHIG